MTKEKKDTKCRPLEQPVAFQQPERLRQHLLRHLRQAALQLAIPFMPLPRMKRTIGFHLSSINVQQAAGRVVLVIDGPRSSVCRSWFPMVTWRPEGAYLLSRTLTSYWLRRKAMTSIELISDIIYPWCYVGKAARESRRPRRPRDLRRWGRSPAAVRACPASTRLKLIRSARKRRLQRPLAVSMNCWQGKTALVSRLSPRHWLCHR
jgi:hypothetical protein